MLIYLFIISTSILVVIEIYKRNILGDIFEELYNNKEEKFLSLIKDYSIKD